MTDDRVLASRTNAVLAALAPGRRPTTSLEVVHLRRHAVLHETGDAVEAVWFPLTCVLSVATTDRDEALDVTTVGREGLVDLSGLLGATVHGTRAVCRVPGQAARLPVALARQLLVAETAGRTVLHRYVEACLGDLMQRLACNRAHSSEQRCACWLLKTADRTGADAFRLTHATLATMLGVRRATVSDSLALLQRTGIVRSDHGTVTVLDRTALEAATCDCYPAFERRFPAASG